MDRVIPARETSHYCGDFRDAPARERVRDIFEDSVRIARTSRDPKAAQARFELAVETYHQLQSYDWGEAERAGFERTMADLALEKDSAPERVAVDEPPASIPADAEAPVPAPEQAEPLVPEAAADLSSALETAAAADEGPGTDDGVEVDPPPLPERDVEVEAEVEAEVDAEVDAGTDAEVDAGTEVEITAGVLARLQPAIVDNGFPVVNSIRLESRAATDLRDLTLTITAEPAFAAPLELAISEIGAGRIQHVPAVVLALERAFFDRLTERAAGRLLFSLTCDGRCIGETGVDLGLCPPGVWPGLGVYPEFLAAFVLPNEPAVQRVLGSARDFLAAWTGSPSLDGYQSRDRTRVLQMAAAVYAALQTEELTYVNPPASFVDRGQRVRLAHEVLEHRMGTCLDLTLLYAACLEQIGLHPILLLVEEHAFAGVWLLEESFSEPIVQEPLRLINHHDLGELALVDPTAVASRPSIDFDAAREEARRHLVHKDRFQCAIDVQRARRGQVRPLARVADEAADEGTSPKGVAPATPTDAPTTAGLAALERLSHTPWPGEPGRTEDRLDRWCRKLLDLTMRNRLLNFRPSKRTIPLLCPDASRLEDGLAEGEVYRILPRPIELEKDSSLHRAGVTRFELIEAVRELLVEDLGKERIRADLAKEELANRLVTLYREARTAVEEGGQSNLYLAVGFLEFQEASGSKQSRRAPILLLPVELKRSSVRGGISLALGGDQPHINVTLLEYLRRDHELNVDGLDELPEDQSGIDVERILQGFRQAIRGRAGWAVVGELALGIFSFAKILIWNDLMHRHEELMANPLVRHLVRSPNEPWEDGIEFPRAEELDDRHAATDVLCPMSADSSQLAAVLAAAQGKSFVLQGPPGTGKSQTITNLIAHCLAEGKRVLFVSEKMAALAVVHARLREVGLSEACLELHSSKARKTEVLEQLRAAFEARASGSSAEWRKKAKELQSLREELNAYVRALHKRYPSGESPFDALSRLTAFEGAPDVELGWSDVAKTSEERLSGARRALQGVVEHALEVDLRPGHPFLSIGRCEYSIQWDRDARAALEVHAERLAALIERAAAARSMLELGERQLSWDAYVALAALLPRMLAPPAALTAPMLAADGPELAARVAPWLSAGREAAKLGGELSARYREPAATLPLEDLERLEREAHTAWWLGAWSKRNRIRKAFRSIASKPSSVSTASALEDLRTARRLAELNGQLDELTPAATELFGTAWRGADSDTGELEAAIAWTRGFDESASAFEHETSVERDALREACRAVLIDGRGSESIAPFVEAWDRVDGARRDALGLLELDDDWRNGAAEEDALDAEAELARTWMRRWKEVNVWCSWRRARRTASDCGLEAVTRGLEQGLFPVSSAVDAFELAYAEAWYTAVSSAEPVLAQFLGSDRQRRILRFRRIDDEVTLLVREELRNRILSRGVTADGAPRSSEQGILKHELTKKKRHWALRKLFAEIPTLLPRLKPCMLMSPMSVAQYLDAAREPFDLVVFDEASQIPVWDAIGAIARARQVVVVGDPKQLPPTSFFARGDDEDELQDEIVEDQESILDECLACGIPEHPLDWHYRSRHESLIEFSNSRYYQNRLVTFPACEERDLGVSLRHVAGGIYDRGKSRTNRIEAEALVDEVALRLRDPRRAMWSIGVVTFNQTQQLLIQDLLDEKRKELPELEPAFAEDNPDAVFVKNLENVQGDERDVILFSVAYGPDPAGRVRMEFGPLNRDGGERRLNVAITRARREAVVFTSLKSEQIDLGRTQARGVQDLKLYLEFAEKGPRAFARELSAGGAAESPFEAEVLAALRVKGWDVHPQIGCSGYRIDLAVVDPDAPGRYLLGVECDGANYHSAKTARDRDKLRQSVLEGLGWHLHRVWSSDWWHDPEREVDAIERALEEARRRKRRARETELAPESPAPFCGSAAATVAPADQLPVTDDPLHRNASTPEPTGARVDPGPEPPRIDPAPAEPAAAPVEQPGTPYSVTRLEPLRVTQDEFYAPGSNREIGKSLDALVRNEAPISLRSASRRVAAQWGFERVGKRTVEKIELLLSRRKIHREDDLGIPFLWKDASGPEAFETFRLPGPEGPSQRTAEDIHTLEFANAAQHVLAQFGGMAEEDLLREVGRMFRYGRLGSRVKARLTESVDRLVRRGRAVREEGMIRPGGECEPR